MIQSSLILITALYGCTQVGIGDTWHKKHRWNAEDYFTDGKVISLCKAIEANNVDEMKRLIDAGADVNALGKDNMTPLLWAYPDNQRERFKLLLERGADPNVFIKSDFGVKNGFLKGDSLTHMVCKSDFPHFYDVFKHGGDPNLQGKNVLNQNETPIFTVIRAGGPEVKQRIDVLLKKGADINYVAGTTPLMKAVTYGGQYDLAIYLIENGANVKLYDRTERIKVIHHLYQEKFGHLKTAGKAQVESFNKLLKLVEAQGESLKEAEADYKRWESWTGTLEIKAQKFKQEVEQRKKREREKAE